MAEDKRNYAEDLIRIADALSEPALEMSDEEILQELRDHGDDPAKVAAQTKELLFAALKDYKQHRLRAARQDYESKTSAAVSVDRASMLPQSAEERRQLLALVIAQQPTLGHSLLTLQHRQLDEVTDADVESLLTELQDLGALDDLDLPGNRK